MENVFDTLKERGFLYQSTDEDGLRKMLENKKVTLYLGIDATATSLHIGSLIGLVALSHFQKAGHKVICVVGGGTTLVGDPSGKDEMRKMLTPEDIEKNITGIKNQIEKYISFDGNNPAIMVNNYDWLKDLNYIDILREVGPYLSVNTMITRDSVKKRWEKGLSFLEFNYSILQAYDFYHLNKTYNCDLQVGGSDQWGNIITGYELIRKKTQNKVQAMTWPLITTSTGAKMGKTEGGAIWLDSEKLSPYDFYQYWINTTDDDVERFLALYTYLPMDEIKKLGKLEGAEIREAKKILAYECTKITHGEQETNKAKKTSDDAFGGNVKNANIPTINMPIAEIEQGVNVLDLFINANLGSSKGEVRRLIKQGGAYINDDRVEDPNMIVTKSAISDDSLVLRSGKKKYVKVNFN